MKLFTTVKTTGVIICACLFLTTGCEKVKEKNLVGTWKVESTNADIMIGNQTLVEFIMEALGISETEAQAFANYFSIDDEVYSTIEFKEGGTYTTSDDDGESVVGTWVLSDDGETLTLTEPDDSGGEDYVIVLDIVSFSKSEMELKMTEIEKDDLDEDGVDETMTIKLSIKLSKE